MKKYKDETKDLTETISFRVTPYEKEKLCRLATRVKMSKSEWLRFKIQTEKI